MFQRRWAQWALVTVVGCSLVADRLTAGPGTLLGSIEDDHIWCVAVDPASGDIVVAGFTNSTDFPS